VSERHSDDQFETGEFDRDDELRALLRGGDPARDLSPADPAALAHLLEDIMSAGLDIRPDADEGSRATGTRGRNRLTWLVAAAAAAMIAGVGGFAIAGLSGNDGSPPQASDHRTSSAPDGQAAAPLPGVSTQLTGAAPTGRCAAPGVIFIEQGDQAFEGTVTAIDGTTVTLLATQVFAGEVGETVQVAAPDPGQFGGLIQAVDFQVGQTYLVSATDGSMLVCGNSGKATGELRSLYTEAFVR
jgi:hypothetical protein